MKLCIGHDHPALPGHFPNEPIVPGVVILDHVQRAIEATSDEATALRLVQVKFLRPLLPEQEARIEISPKGGGFVFRVLHGAETLVTGEMVLVR